MIFRIVLIAGTLVSMYFVPWPILKAFLRPVPDTVEEQLEQSLAFSFRGAMASVVKANGEINNYAAGWHNHEETVEAYPQAYFKIASISKLYDVACLSKLVHQKKLNLDSSLTYFFPSWAHRLEYADQITLRMLVQHRSGIYNFTNSPGFWSNPPKNEEALMNLFLDRPNNFKPNEDYEYCNTNYYLIEKIIELASQENKFEFLKREILIPNKLFHTFGNKAQLEMDSLISGYYVGVDEDIKTADYSSMVATTADVGRFVYALNTGSLFSAKEHEIFKSLYPTNHTGLIPGYQSYAEYFPEIDAVVVLSLNSTNFEGYEWNLGSIAHNRIKKIVKKQDS